MWNYIYTPDPDELYHHGVKGMKWGVRRYQNKDGSLKPAGRKRYSEDSTQQKSKHRLALESKFKSLGMSDEEAARHADKRIKTEKILAVAGATTVIAATAYVARKHLKEKADELIKAGDSLQRIETSGDGKLHDVFYAAKDKSDRSKYVGLLGYNRQAQTGKAYLMDIGVQTDMKVAGRDKAFGTFKKLYDNDSEFRNGVAKLANENSHGGNPAKGNVKKMYDNFNSNLFRSNIKKNSEVDKFYDALKSEGYSAIRDINDMKFSGYNAKNPLIVFGGSNKVSVTSVRELGRNEVLNNVIKDGAKETGKALAKTAAAGVTVSSIALYSDAYAKPATVKSERKGRNK